MCNVEKCAWVRGVQHYCLQEQVSQLNLAGLGLTTLLQGSCRTMQLRFRYSTGLPNFPTQKLPTWDHWTLFAAELPPLQPLRGDSCVVRQLRSLGAGFSSTWAALEQSGCILEQTPHPNWAACYSWEQSYHGVLPCTHLSRLWVCGVFTRQRPDLSATLRIVRNSSLFKASQQSHVSEVANLMNGDHKKYKHKTKWILVFLVCDNCIVWPTINTIIFANAAVLALLWRLIWLE